MQLTTMTINFRHHREQWRNYLLISDAVRGFAKKK